MISEEEFEQLKRDVAKCKESVHADIRELKEGQTKFNLVLTEQAVERKKYNTNMSEKLDSLSKALMGHTEDEMGTIKKLQETLNQVLEQTAHNTNHIQSAEFNREMDRRVAQELDAINKPRAEMWNKVKMTALSVATVAVMGAMGSGIKVIYDLYNMLHGGQ